MRSSPTELLIFTRTMGEPYLEECLRRIRDHTPVPHRLIVWVNGAGEETVTVAREYADELIITTENKGCVATCGYVLLYEEYRELVRMSCAMMVEPGWIEALRRPFREHQGVGLTGMRSEFGAYTSPPGVTEECSLANLPDHLVMTSREVVDRVGSISPSFQKYGHEITEFSARTLTAGFRVFAVDAKCHRHQGRHDGRDRLAERERYLQHNLGVWQRCAAAGYRGYEWWRSDL